MDNTEIKKQKKDVVFRFLITKDQKKELIEKSKKVGKTPSEFLRSLFLDK